MIEYIKMAIGVIAAMMDAMPQEFTDTDGVKSKIPDGVYVTLVSDGAVAMVTGSGYIIPGVTDAQLRAVAGGFCTMYLAYKKAPRVVA
jgi:hypothetical protein